MRTIKFRGKCAKDSRYAGEWVEGGVLQCKESDDVLIVYAITDTCSCTYHVDPDTVGQFTGLYDKNGKEIYEGDIVQWGDSEHKIKQVVEFRNGAFGYVYDTIGSFVPYAANTNFDFAALGTDKRFEVCGNIHDNSGLIKKGGNDE